MQGGAKEQALYVGDLQAFASHCSKSRIILCDLGCDLCDLQYIYRVLRVVLHNWCNVGVRCGLM